MKRVFAFSLALFVALISSSCGESRYVTFPVQGQVELDGKLTPGAMVALHPVDATVTVHPVGTVGADGNFKISTYGSNDGAPAGDYTVTVTWYQLVGEGTNKTPGPNVVPNIYRSPKTSPLKVAVREAPTDLGKLAIDSKVR